jgi:hypothetical protein
MLVDFNFTPKHNTYVYYIIELNMSATWTMKQIRAEYPNVLSMAQNRSTGQYMLAIVTAAAQGTTDVACRAFKSNNYGVKWDLLENLFSNTTPYTDGRDLNYTTLQNLGRPTLYGCAISDDGKYQAVTQKSYDPPRFMWYSTNYGFLKRDDSVVYTDPLIDKNDGLDDGRTVGKNPNAGWKWMTSSGTFPLNDTGYLIKYTPGLFPVLVVTTGAGMWLDQSFTRAPGSTNPSIVAGNLISTRDRPNSTGVEFTMDVPDMYPTGYSGTAVYCVFFITSGQVVRRNNNSAFDPTVTATIINPPGWPVSATEGGGVVVTSDNSTVYAARFVSGTGGGIWKSTNNGDSWTQIQSGINVNAIGISSNGEHIIAGPRTPTSGSGTFYISSNSGLSWITQVVSFSGYINYLYITNDGMRAIGGANRTEASSWVQYSSLGYFSYVGPDIVSPNMTITASASGLPLANNGTTNNASITLTFETDEPITGFDKTDITVTGGTLSEVTGSGSLYTATFAPGNPGAYTINVAANKFIDSAGNANIASNTFNFTFDNTKPEITIAATASGSTLVSGSTTKNTPIALTFSSSKATTDFDKTDISVTGGTLSAITGSGTVYSATFAPNANDVSGKTECSIAVQADKFIDSVGNYNIASTTFNFTFDNTKPGMTITATASGSNLASGSTTKNTPIALTFTSTEATIDFDRTDISFNGGILSAITGSGTVYSATFAPNANNATGRTECSIAVQADKFVDPVGNSNNAAPTFNFTFDNTKPGMIITATASGSNIASGSTTKNTPILLTFTSPEPITGFDETDISFNGGTLYAVTGSGSVYTATFAPNANAPTGRTECSISVPADKFTDAVGNDNNAAPTFNFTFDNTKPTMEITATAGGSNLASGSTTKNTSIALTFTSAEATIDFDETDIIVTGGTLSAVTGSGNVYTATFAPNANDATGRTECSISVPADKFTDAVGNANTAASTFNFTFDNTKPGMIITATASGSTLASGSTTKNTSIALTFTSSEATIDFDRTDISFNGGTLSAITGSGNVYSATFTPNQNDVSGKTECSIAVQADKFTDSVGNSNNAAPTFNFTFDNTKPDMIITATASGSTLASGSTTKNTPIALTFTSSEATIDFDRTDISFNGGTLSAVTGSGNVYSATFTPNQNDVSGKTECSIAVQADKFTDSVGNANTAASTFNFTFDNTKPGMTITATASGSNLASGSTTNNTPIALTFTSSEATNNFGLGDIAVTNGALTNFAGSGAVYTAIFTPRGAGVCTIDVDPDVFTDSATNLNNPAAQFIWTFDSVPPTMTITSTTAGVTSGSITNDATIELKFTSSKATDNFEVGDISVTNGTLSPLTGSGAVYTATFTPEGGGTCTIDVAGGVYTDAVGNTNTAATRFNWTFRRTVSFDTNTLTIVNSIDANATDPLLFVLPSGEEMSNINVTAFTGTGTITYDLSTGGASISSGTFTGTGTNLLGTNVLIASTNTTYILTLAANASLTYTIVGTKIVNYGNAPPTALSFVNNVLTIQNSIDSADVDKVSFDVNAGRLLISLEVTRLLNTNRISYVLDISGGSTVSSGSFTQTGFNLLNENVLEPDTNTTYILTLTSGGTNTYSILGMSRINQDFDIDKFCSRQGIARNNVGYNRIVTSGNNPSISNKMRYSQLLRTQRFKTVRTYNVSVPPVKEELPLYLFSTGQIFTQSVFR